MKKFLTALASACMLACPAIAQAPSLQCAIHHVPAFYTGKQKTTGSHPTEIQPIMNTATTAIHQDTAGGVTAESD